MSADGPYYNIREVIAAHGAHSPQAAQLLAEMVEARRAAAAEAQGFVPSEVWAKENMMRPFVPKLTEAAQRAPDGRDPTSQTSAARSGTISTGAWGPMSHFFTGEGDTFDNATDKAAWMEGATGGCHWKYNEHAVRNAPVGAGSMCPVEYGGSHVATTDPIVDTFRAPEETATKKSTLTEEERVAALAAAGELRRPDGARYQTELGHSLAQQRVLDAAEAAKRGVNVAAFDYVFAPGLVLAHLVELLLPGRMHDGGQSLVQFALTCKGIYNDVDVKHALASIRGIAEMKAVALDASVRNYFGKEFFRDDMTHTVYRLIRANTIIDDECGPVGDTLPAPPGIVHDGDPGMYDDVHDATTWEDSLRIALEGGLLDEDMVEFSDIECE